MVDEVAERVRALGGTTLGTLTEPLKQTRLKEHPRQAASILEMVNSLFYLAMRRLFSHCAWIWNAVPISFTIWGRVIS